MVTSKHCDCEGNGTYPKTSLMGVKLSLLEIQTEQRQSSKD